MELRPGYKQTEVGVIPEDWDVREVREFARIITGPFGTLLKASEYSESDGVPLISVGEVGDGYFRISEHTPRISSDVAKRLPQYVLRAGDVVFGRKGAVDRSALVSDREHGWFLGSDGISIRPTVNCNSPYLAAQFRGESAKAWLVQNAIGTTMASLNQGILGRAKIPFAPLPEQSAVATVLSDVDALVSGLDKLIAKKRDIKRAAMQQLLTNETRLPGFRGGWEVKRFGEFVSIRNQKVMPAQVEPETLCVELEHLGQGDGRLLTRGGASSSSASKYRFRVGDVLFGRLRSYLRKYWCASEEGICTTEIWPLMFDKERVHAGFVFALVQTDNFIEAASVSYGTHMPRADWGVIRNFEVALPPIEEQTAIAEVLSDIDIELASLEARRDKTAQIKQGMMQELLTGKTRLV